MSADGRTVNDVKSFLKTCEGAESQQRMKFYDGWAETYEQDLSILNYRAPNQAVDFLMENFSGRPEEVQVLDVACGSGLVAKLMIELGFKHIVGVDGSQGMLDQAAKTGFYKELRLALLGTDPLPAQTGVFDLVMIVGALGQGFVPVSVIRELCLAAKPGGYVCMSINCLESEAANKYTVSLEVEAAKKYTVSLEVEAAKKYTVSLEAELQLMEEEGLWSHVNTKVSDRYMIDVYNNYCDDVQNDKYTNGVKYLYRKSLQ